MTNILQQGIDPTPYETGFAVQIERCEAVARKAFLGKVNRALQKQGRTLRLADSKPWLRPVHSAVRRRLPVPVAYDPLSGAGWLCRIDVGRIHRVCARIADSSLYP